MRKKINEQFVSNVFETDSEFSEWFGYYNYDVISCDGNRMLCNRAKFDGRAITVQDNIELGWYDLDTGNWNEIGNTNSFNWQQGAMLQWIPETENKVVYNCAIGDKFKSVIYDVKTKQKKIIDFPVYCLTPDGKYSISLNYERSYWCRAYHYQNIINKKYNVRVAEDDGVFCVDLENGNVTRIIDINDVIKFDFEEVFNKSKHWLEHIMISPDGSKITFLHRFSFGDGYKTRICISDINGENLQVIPGYHNKEWSHFGWKGDKEFCIYTVDNGEFAVKYTEKVMQNNALKVKESSNKNIKDKCKDFIKEILPQVVKDRIIGRKKYYQHYVENESGLFTLQDIYDGYLLNIDGHPSFTKDGKYMITDSYPDERGYQRLIIYNTINKKGIIIGKFYAAFKGNPASCDLHPKLCFNDNYIVVDTAYSGKHRMNVLKINWDRVKNKLN